MQFYLLRDGEQTGPFTIAQMQLWWRVRMLDPGQLFWKEGSAGWAPLSSIAGLLQTQDVAAVAAASEPAPKLAVRWVEVGEYSVEDLKVMLDGASIPSAAEYWNDTVKGWRPIAGILGGVVSVGPGMAPGMGLGVGHRGGGGMPPMIPAPAARPSRVEPRQFIGGGDGRQFLGQPSMPLQSAKPGGEPLQINSERSRTTYVLLALFLGTLGVHNFYAGYYRRGICEVVTTAMIVWVVAGGWLESYVWVLLVYLFIGLELMEETSDGEGRTLI